jgi:hypothetical protein
VPDSKGEAMSPIQLYKEHPDTYERQMLGILTEKQLDFLMLNLEDDFEEDEEYYLIPDTLDFLRENGADRDLLSMLERALVDIEDGVDILYLIE